DQLKILVSGPERPRYKGQPFPWYGWFNDGQYLHDARLDKTTDEAVVYLDFRFLRQPERETARWIRDSDSEQLRNRVIWVAGRTE
ncbi:hypothetical protein, partial [Salmonella enterica]|uniref:hypothetical protein n=1 Tax=Salmonella enterica TaxID=28901 RepID=UPI003299C2C4